ncbi:MULTISPECIES: membrane-bound lytic murein transglycosylase MltF [Salinivibrio]|uniref:Membrane-bound lytic murein transglycosylase F n=1 Tax=Salinivibrio proteolyticus TaxID=334715 RepID=A0ABY7LFZ3_9GAMM|nr:membrane-bound lytic murein transglycosylase MltF [Salinivibrio proteolyticus]ODP96930.1 lytic transglycosylase F [Salinivibrio sp. DV]WBA16145.1 membrane-bound lytic murein transglycosylase MltF [Salinivibrio proteolyticus]
MLTLPLAGCDWHFDDRTTLEKIRDRGVLRVGTLNNQLSYYIGPNGPTGLDYDLAKRFADKLGVKLEMTPTYTLSGLFPALERGDVDIIAAGLTITPQRLDAFRPGPAYYFVSQQVVYKNGHWRPRDVDDFNRDDAVMAVVEGSSHDLTLQSLKQAHPALSWQVVQDADDDELLKQVANGDIDFTIADSVDIALIQRTHPDITVAMELSEDEPVAWFMKKQGDSSVYALMVEFFGDLAQSGELAILEEKYFGHVDQFDYVDTRAFLRAIESKLPKWEPLFKKYANEFDWRLLAALSYQESHWNPRAISPTGVRGMMMLTLPTAKSVGVRNRLDPEQSIKGGALYLQRVLERVPDSVNPHERIWFALASYNIGFGHMMDARRLTEAQGANPNSWSDVKKRLPMLAKRQYYTQTRYGYARGYEALSYVENIRRYYQSILGYEKAHIEALDNEQVEDLGGLQTIVAPAPEQESETVTDTDETSPQSDANQQQQ